MKKKVLATVLSAAMVCTMLAGCGSSAATTTASSAPAASTTASTAAASTESMAAESSMAASSTAAASSSDLLAGTQFEGTKANSAYAFDVAVKSFQSTYWQAAIQGMEQASKELGVTYDAQGPNSESDIADQVNILNNYISGKPAGIALAACDTSSVLDSLQSAKDAGIPVVCFDTGVDKAPEGSVVATVATDNSKAGALAADKMYELLKDKISSATAQVRIGEVNQDATALNIQQRGLGFINEMIKNVTADGKTVAVTGNQFYVDAAEGANGKEADANVVIEVAVPAQTTVDLCSTEASKIMSKSDLIGIFGSNQTSAEGVLAANNNLNTLNADPTKGVIAVGFDAGSVIKGAITDGTMAGAVTQSPLLMGYYAIYALTKVANGDTVKDVPMDGYWYDNTNMTDPQIAPNLYD